MLATLAIVIVYNPVGNEALTAWAYVPANLVVGGVLIAVARWSGLTWDLMGMRADRLARGAKVGLAAAERSCWWWPWDRASPGSGVLRRRPLCW